MPGYYKQTRPAPAAPAAAEVIKVVCDGCGEEVEEGEEIFCGVCFGERPKELVEIIKEVPVERSVVADGVEMEKPAPFLTDENKGDVKMDFLWRIAITKAVKAVVAFGVAKLASFELGKYGVTVDANILTGAVLAFVEVKRNWLKQKFGWKFL